MVSLYGEHSPLYLLLNSILCRTDFIRIRKLFTYGATRDYLDHRSFALLAFQLGVHCAGVAHKVDWIENCLGWVREGDADHDGCAVVICNGTAEGRKRMQAGQPTAFRARLTYHD